MVEIKTYKKHKILYEDGEFFAKKSGKEFYKSDKESIVIESIDAKLEEDEKRNIEKIKADRLEKTNKKIAKAVISLDAKKFRRFAEELKNVNNEVRLLFDNGTLSSVTMDPANVALLKSKIDYTGDIDLFEVGVNINSVFIFLNTAHSMYKPDKIDLRFELGEGSKLCISDGFGEIKLPCMEIHERETKMPDLDYDNEIMMSCVDLQRIITLSATVAESVTFETKKDKLIVSAEGDLSSYVNKNAGVSKGGDYKAKYSIDYLKLACRIFKGRKLKLQIKTDYPLLINSDETLFVLAPRVEDE